MFKSDRTKKVEYKGNKKKKRKRSLFSFFIRLCICVCVCICIYMDVRHREVLKLLMPKTFHKNHIKKN